MGGLALFVLVATWVMRTPLMIVSFLASLAFGLSRNRPEAKSHAAIPSLTEGSGAIPVALTIFDAKGKATGKEKGWVAFAEGWLVYEGLRTSFSLTPSEVSGSRFLLQWTTLRLRDGRRIDLEVLTDEKQTHLPARGIDVPKLAVETRRWLEGEHGTGQAVLPPRRTHPETAARRLTLPFALSLLTLVLSVLAVWSSAFGMAAPLLLAALGSLAWGTVGLRRFARDLPRLIE